MSLTLSEQQLAYNVYRISIDDPVDGSTYYWYLDGVFIGSTIQPFRIFTIEPGSAVYIEVYDSAATSPGRGFPGYAILSFAAVDNATTYRVDRYTTSWETVAYIPETGADFYTYRTRHLDTGEHQFRVVPIGNAEGTARNFTFNIITRPSAPAVSYTYESGVLTVAAS